ncbi:MAG: ATP-dependent Clp protease ATP-binding subunit [Myxococcaceae bacterium]
MNCENCGQRPAVVFMRQRVQGRERTVTLCNHCASALNAGMEGGPSATLEGMFESWMGPRPRSRDNLLSQLSEAAQGVLQRASQITVQWGHDRLRTEFLLLALLEQVPEMRELLVQARVPVDDYEDQLGRVIPRREPRSRPAVGLSSSLKRALQLARMQAQQLGHKFIGPEHLLLGIAVEGESFAAQFLGGRIYPDLIRDHLAAGPQAPRPTLREDRLPPMLTRYSRDLSAFAQAGELDPVIGRDPEIERVIRILSRKTKNNPVLIGEPGVGKTAIAEGLAQRIEAGMVPDTLRGKRVIALDLGSMLGGTRLRGEFEERFTNLMKEIRELEGKIILFIDELHTLVGAGAGEGAMDASNMIKPALARGELQCLGATTLDEYRENIEQDAALERRFQPVMVSEPTPEQAIEILLGLRDSYEAHHRVKIADAALDAAVELSDRYISDRFLPDKAIDLMDEAAAMVRLASHTEPVRVRELEAELTELEKEKEACVAAEKYDEAARLKGEMEGRKTELEGLKTNWQKERGMNEPTVTPEAIATVVSEWTGIPAHRLRQEERERLLEMERELQRRVIGQEDAIRAVSQAVRRARAGLKDPNRPIGSFFFLGPTGVGKTETARALAEYLFNDEEAMVRLDMSEFMERHTVSRLVGAPPGYVGYEEAGRLTEAVRRRPYSVILFDEVEKAHPDVFNVLLQLLDDGRLTDAQGRTVDFKNTVIIMTSNIGAEELNYRGALGFQAASAETESRQAKARDQVMAALRRQFRPEFLNRVDEIIVFQPLSKPQLTRILDNLIDITRRKLRGQAVSLELTDAAKDVLAERGYDPKYGARPLRRVIQRQIENAISERLLRGEIREGDTLRVDFTDGEFRFHSEHPHKEEVQPH